MLKFFLILFLFFQDPMVAIASPQADAILRGQVEIQGRMDTPNFASAELAFKYASDPGESWFTLQAFPQPIKDPTLAVWDTTTITDGDYSLRLRVFLQDGTFQDAIVTNLKIRNDVPLPTATPTATEITFNFQPPNATPGVLPPVETPQSATAYPTSTPLPANPASLTTDSIFGVFWQSVLFVLVVFLFFFLILRLRKNS